MLNFVHYSRSSQPIIFKNELQHPDKHYSWGKPSGLWVTPEFADTNWKEWCEDNGFCLDRLKYVHDVTFSEHAKILEIKTNKELLEFDREYGTTRENHYRFSTIINNARFKTIKWYEVAEKYHGILISPYQWDSRFPLLWYYGWDCASGCIWNKEAISSIIPRVETGVEHETEQVS